MLAHSHCVCRRRARRRDSHRHQRPGERSLNIFPPLRGGINNGSTFPTGNQNFGGVPFAIPTGPNTYWNGGVSANCESGTVSLTIPVGVSGVTSAFTWLNTMWGQAGPYAYLFITFNTFNGSNGATVTQPLVGGVNVRDFNNDGYQNTINTNPTTQVRTNGLGQRLDLQEYILPRPLPARC